MRPELIAPLRRVLDWLVSHRDSETGALICRDHKIEHTGKSAGAVVLAVELARHAPRGEQDELLVIAREQCERIVSRLEREGDSTCFTFRPGRHDPYNCSNSVIDGGACSDALAACVMFFGDRLTAGERERFTHASVLHAQTYLRYTIVDKGVPAQCAWAMTGAAQAYRLSGHEVLKLACEVGAERIAGIQRPDGSVPYHPVRLGAAHPGAEDASAYYQSRVHAFTDFALRAVQGEGTSVSPPDHGFSKGLEFLHGLQGPDGIKVGGVEAKPWYWGAHYEVVSHPFDIAAFAAEWRRTGSTGAQVSMLSSWRAWLSHLAPSGEPTSHLGAYNGTGARRDSYQCSFFWAAHACWISRSLAELEVALDAESAAGPEGLDVRSPGGGGPGTVVRHFEDVDLVRMDSPSISVWIRGKRPPGNAFHGSPVGGGIIRVHDAAAGRDLFNPRPFERRPEASWSGRRGTLRPGMGWREGKGELKFSAWLMRNRWRSGARKDALLEPLRTARRAVVDPAGSAVSTGFDREPELKLEGDGTVRMVSSFAHREGSDGLGRVERVMRLTALGLDVEERCVDPGGTSGLWFRAPERAVVHSETNHEVRYSIGGHRSEDGAG